jgi:hypothetical protein
VKIFARICQADVPNSAGRIYPRAVLEKIATKNVYATLGMPEGTAVEMEKVAALVGNWSFDSEGYLVGEVAVMGTASGQVLMETVKSGGGWDYRLAGIGTVQDNVVSDFRVISIGVVPKGQGS